jgi:acetolactate synthase-1/2/3 large subunit
VLQLAALVLDRAIESMKKTGSWLVRYALEQVGVRHTFGIPGVHNTEIYDQLASSPSIEPMLVTQEAYGAFMADAVSRCSDSLGTLLIVPAAGVAYASAGIGEAFLDGVAMLVICGGIRADTGHGYQLHDIDQHAMLAPITKGTWKAETQADIVPMIFAAAQLATAGEPGPVFVEIPVDLQLFKGEVGELPVYSNPVVESAIDDEAIAAAVRLLLDAEHPALFVGWGACDASDLLIEIAELLHAPVATTLQGLSVFPASHPLHCGYGFGPAAVPAAHNAFADCDCLLAVATRFAEIATASYGVKVPENLIHTDINPKVFDVNFPAKVKIPGDARQVLAALLEALKTEAVVNSDPRAGLRQKIALDKHNYLEEWLKHDSGNRVNPARFFQGLRQQLKAEDIVIADDGNHTFLTAELMPIEQARCFFSPTDFNCMGYCVPAVAAAKLMHPERQVVGIVGDGAFMMSCMEILNATKYQLGGVYFVFNDGELAQIAQAQEIPFNRKTCSVLGAINIKGVADATGAGYLHLETNKDIESVISEALATAAGGQPVIVDVNIDYSKRTRFTDGVVKTNLDRFPLADKVRIIGRAVWRKVKH